MLNYKEIAFSELSTEELETLKNNIFSSSEEYKLECFEYLLDNKYCLYADINTEHSEENKAVESFLSSGEFEEIRQKFYDQIQEDDN